MLPIGSPNNSTMMNGFVRRELAIERSRNFDILCSVDLIATRYLRGVPPIYIPSLLLMRQPEPIRLQATTRHESLRC